MQSFTPGPQTSADYRRALGQFATGVTVVTLPSPLGPLGITVNSFTSVSLDPALILWCPAKRSQRHDVAVAAAHFALHVLRDDQHRIAQGFSRGHDAFDLCDWEMGAHEVPLLSGCAARFECETVQRIDAGDHTIVLARVANAATGQGEPLIFHGGRYGRYTDLD